MEIALLVVTTVVGIIGWLTRALAKTSYNKINDMDKTVKVLSNNLYTVREDIVGIKKDIEYLRKDVDKNIATIPIDRAGRFTK